MDTRRTRLRSDLVFSTQETPEGLFHIVKDPIRLLGLVTPHAGVVATPRVKERVGQYVQKGDLIAKVLELSTVTAEIEIPEGEIADVRAGQEVLLKARAPPGRTFSGKVIAIAPRSSSS
jgi:multidrug resistance efflux pump